MGFPIAPPPLQLPDISSEEPMSFPTDPWGLAMLDAEQMTPSVPSQSWATIDAGLALLPPSGQNFYSATPFPWLSAASFSMDAEELWEDIASEREDRLIQAARVLLAAGAVVRHEALQHHPLRSPRLVRLLQSYAAVRAYRIVGGQVVRWAAGAHGALLGKTL